LIQKNRLKKKLINLGVKELIKWVISGCHAICTTIAIKKGAIAP
jgi:hypothetical protein